MLDERFARPADICRGTDFWMLNDKLDEDELRRQLHSMRSQGVASLIARTYIGLRSDYPGKDWMEKMHIVVDEAKKLGMTIFMQAGYMPEAVLDLPEEFSLGDLRCVRTGEGEGELLDACDGYEYRLVSSKTILDMLSPEACAFYVKQSYEDMWKDFRDEFGKTILSVWVDEPSFRRVSLPWTKNLPKAYEELWHEAFPKDKVHLLFKDGEGDRLMRLRYWRTVLYLMKKSYFQSVKDWCDANHIMFSGHLMAEDTMESQISATCFTMPMYKYFGIPGIDYLTAEMDWVYGEIKPEHPYADIWTKHGAYMTPLQCTSAAHQAGKNIVLAEMYGVSTENLVLRDQKQMFDHFASLGINHRSVHGMFYSLYGRGKRAYPPHVHDYQPYWEKYHLLTDALARESEFVRSGAAERDVVVLHPIETGFSLYHGTNADGVHENALLNRADVALCEAVRTLVANQVNFELGDEDSIAEMGSVSAEGKFVIGEMAYSCVILPHMAFIRETTLALLREFQAKGGKVLSLGELPAMADSGRALTEADFAGVQRADTTSTMLAFLKDIPMAYRFERRNNDMGVQIYFRKDGDDLLFFITNVNHKRTAEGTLCIPAEYGCQRFDELRGSVSAYPVEIANGETRADIFLPEGGTILLRFAANAERKMPEAIRPTAAMGIKPAWKIRRHAPNALVLEFFRYAKGDEPLSKDTLPVLTLQDHLLKEEYNGEITLQTEFRTEIPLKGLKLAVESPELQNFCLDGKPISNAATGKYVCKAFQTIALPDVEAGTHTLTVRRHFEPLRKAKTVVTSLFENLGGVELEQMTLLGDFAVRSAAEPSLVGCVRVNYDFVLTAEDATSGDELITHGYPFYCGVMDLETEIELPEGIKNPRIAIDGLNAGVAEVLVNGTSCGELCWAPYAVPLKNLHSGKNTLTLRLYGTLANLLGPWHRTVGEIGACWGGYSQPNLPWLGFFAHEDGKTYPDWEYDRIPDRIGWTESYLMLPFGIVHPAIQWDIA